MFVFCLKIVAENKKTCYYKITNKTVQKILKRLDNNKNRAYNIITKKSVQIFFGVLNANTGCCNIKNRGGIVSIA